jgi:hypothetical protein
VAQLATAQCLLRLPRGLNPAQGVSDGSIKFAPLFSLVLGIWMRAN